jgi:outer membrane protein TolC
VTKLPTVTLESDFASMQDFDYFNRSSVHRRLAVAAEREADFKRSRRQQGLIDEFTPVTAELPEVSTKVDLEPATLAEHLEYADLQNLLGERWRWAP